MYGGKSKNSKKSTQQKRYTYEKVNEYKGPAGTEILPNTPPGG